MKPTTASLFVLQRDYCPLAMVLKRAQRQAVQYRIDDEAEYFIFKDGSTLTHVFMTEDDDDRLYFY